jgi:beta-glucosidase-like glycosyl hydrolase
MVQIGSARDVAKVRASLLRAADTGEISQSRLADAAARVLELKRQAGLLRGR